MEAKEDMKKRGIESPNRADGLALTFALPVAQKQRDAYGHPIEGRQEFAKDVKEEDLLKI